MRILIVGAYGLVGGYVGSRLIREGHEVIGAGRDIVTAARRFPAIRWVAIDLRVARASDWMNLLSGVDAVVNCAGALQDSPRDDLQAVHGDSTAALAEACIATRTRRFVQISAAGVDRVQSRFGKTKRAADEALAAFDLEWVVLRPGLILAPAAYGGSALLRGLAGFPAFIPALDADALVQTVSVEDVAEAVSLAIAPDAPTRIICDLVADESTRLRDVLTALRAWLGFPAAPVARVPRGIGCLAAWGADGLSWLGWRSPMRSAALDQLANGVFGATANAKEHLDLTLRSLAETLAQWPSGVQDRWHARLYFVKPLLLASLALFWVASGVIGLGRHDAAAALLTEAGMGVDVAQALVLAGSVMDIVLGMLVCARRTAPQALMGMLLVTAAYLAGSLLWLPQLWIDPLGPMLKSVVSALAALTALAMMSER